MRLQASRILELDGLRGIAIILVICFHIALLFPVPSFLYLPMLFGWSGVDLFFVLSGFLIGSILVENREAPSYFKAFYARRVFRIVPVYLLVFLSYRFFWHLRSLRPAVLAACGVPMTWGAYLTFTTNFWIAAHNTMHAFLPVSWSLSIEEQFYLTLPLAVRYIKPKYLPRVVGAAICGILAFRAAACFFGWATQNQAYVLPWFREDALLIGVCCALLVRSKSARQWILRRRVLLFAAAGAMLVAISWMGVALPDATQSPKVAMMMFGLTLVAIFYATLLLIAVSGGNSPLSSVLRIPALRSAGKYSYAVYLFHETLLTAAAALLPAGATWWQKWLSLICALLVMGLMARLSWDLLESKMVTVGHRFSYWGERNPEAVAAQPEPKAAMPIPLLQEGEAA